MMRKILLTILSILLLCCPVYAETVTVECVIDGNTLQLTSGETLRLIGVDAPQMVYPEDEKDWPLFDPSAEQVQQAEEWGVDLMTLHKMGQEAKAFLEKHIKAGEKVRLEYDDHARNKDGELLIYIWKELPYLNWRGLSEIATKMYRTLPERPKHEILINAFIIYAGYAKLITTPPNVKYADLFKKLHTEAIGNRRGIWNEDNFSFEEFINKAGESGVVKYYDDDGNIIRFGDSCIYDAIDCPDGSKAFRVMPYCQYQECPK